MKQIGAIHTPYKRTKEVPYQSSSSEEVCEIEVFMEYGSGLKDTDIRPYAP
ncbi:tRNA (N6-threonylcarbamoyladenosine(37)-N6)-methyltransferase TrmO, partial [Methanophagales archaeon]